MAIAYEREIRSRCSGCGTSPDEWAHNPDAYVGDVEICPGCERLTQENNNEIAKRPGAKVRLIRLGDGIRKMRKMEQDS